MTAADVQRGALRRPPDWRGRRTGDDHSAAGYVPIYASVLIGIAAGLVCHYAIQLKNRMKWDDALDVWGVHGMGGLLGILLLRVFAARPSTPTALRDSFTAAPRFSSSSSQPASAARCTRSGSPT